MEKNILNEITRLQDLMGINTKPLINEKKNTEKRLISEIKLKPKLNFPDVKAFDNFRNSSSFKNIGGLLDFNFNNLKGFTTIPQNIDGLIKHLTDFKPIWVASLVDGGDTIQGATDAINSSLSTLKKIKTKSLKRNLGDLIPGKNYRVYETIPEEGGLRNAVLHQYKDTYGKTEWDNFKKLLSTNTAELKKIDADVNAVSDAIKNLNVPKVKGSTPKVKGSTPKPNTQSPSGVVQGSGFISPLTGKEMTWEEAAEAFGSNRTASDNILFYQAWQDGWRPGTAIPEKYKTKLSNQLDNAVEEFGSVSNDAPKQYSGIKGKIEGEMRPDGKTPIYTYKEVASDFGLEDLSDPTHNKLLSDAWDGGWRPGQIIPDEFKINDTEKAVKNLINKTTNSETQKFYDFEKVKEEFGLGAEDNQKLYDAWEEGWRPGQDVPEKFQTGIYKARKNGLDVDLFTDIKKMSTLVQFKNWLKMNLGGWLYKPIAFWEDIFRGASKNKNLLDAFENNLKNSVNRFLTNKSTNLPALREEFLKIKSDKILRKKVSMALLDEMELKLLDEVNMRTNLTSSDKVLFNTRIKDFFVELKKEDSDLSFKLIEDISYYSKNNPMGIGLFFQKYIDDGVKKKWVKIVMYRIWRLISTGTFWNKAEQLAIRNLGNFTSGNAVFQAIKRKIIQKGVLPFFLCTLQLMGFGLGATIESITRTNYFDWNVDVRQKYADWVLNSLIEYNKPKNSILWSTLKLVLPGELENIIKSGIDLIGKIDTETDPYAIKYYESKTVNGTEVGTWIRFPTGTGYISYDKIDKKINELTEKGYKICDDSDKANSSYKSTPLIINYNALGDCSEDNKPEDKKPEDNKTTVTPGQTVEYLAFVANRDLGRSSDPNMYTEQPILNYKNNKVWTISSEKKIVYCFSIDTSYNIYMKQLPESEFSADNIDKINELSGWNPVTEKPISESTMKKLIKKIIMESNKDKKFGEESFEHWKKTFRFHTQDAETKEFKEVSKETIEAKQVEIEKMLDHYRKKYDEDDSFVRSVVDVFSKDKNVKNHIKKIGFNKGLAHISETVQVGGLLKVLSVIRESKELEIWSVKYYNDGNWELVKGSFNDEELKNVGKTVTDRNKKDEERRNPVEGLKKKELTAIEILKQDEKKGLSELPSQVKRKTFEKLRNGWVTEKPYDFLDEFYTVSDINTVFNDKIKIYKLNPTKEFFESLLKNSSKIFIRKGFCKSLNIIKNTKISDEKGKKIFDHILNKCQTKFKGEYGITQINKYL